MSSNKTSEPSDHSLFEGVAHAEKYQSNNWIAQRLVNKFMASILETVAEVGAKNVHEIGCGEGHILGLLANNNYTVRGCDISDESLAVAQRESAKRSLNLVLKNKSIYELDPVVDSEDVIVCCEVLEHLTDPEAGLTKLLSITRKGLVLSVPNEPIWHILNMARGKYLSALGNTPGHFQHWSKNQFIQFVSKHADVLSVRTPLPWTLLHCKPKDGK
jgi:2-polyprenyl-3-methyl-5-hydroxy-6-metoxy-1,4-benzoquinol methylase